MKKLKFIGILLLSTVVVLGLTACGSDESKSSDAEMTISEVVEKKIEISEMVGNGEITQEEADVMYAELSEKKVESKEDEMKRTKSNISDFTGLPSWATGVGMVEPKGLTFIPEDSSITKAGGGYTDSFLAMYSGDVDAVYEAARELSKEMSLTISMDDETLLMADGELGAYSVSLVVADNGKGTQLTYSGYETL